jgi:hypothetical protein
MLTTVRDCTTGLADRGPEVDDGIGSSATVRQDPAAKAFDLEFVSISRHEHIWLKMQPRQYRSLHARAVARLKRLQPLHDRETAQLREQLAAVHAELALTQAQNRDLRQRVFGAKTEQSRSVNALLADMVRPDMRIVQGRGENSGLWNEFMARHHYLGYTPMSGQQLCCGVCAGEQLVALISFAAAAWKLADRERYIGGNDAQRRSRLRRVVNNTRFLILPWVHSPGLASKVLGMAARRLPKDWPQRHGFAPVMLETFVESPRHKGTCCRAAHWQLVGRTTGRGKTSTTHAAQLPAKDVWRYPLRQDFRAILAQQPARSNGVSPNVCELGRPESLSVFPPCPACTPRHPVSSLQIRAIAQAMAVVCAWIRGVLACLSAMAEKLSGSEVWDARQGTAPLLSRWRPSGLTRMKFQLTCNRLHRIVSCSVSTPSHRRCSVQPHPALPPTQNHAGHPSAPHSDRKDHVCFRPWQCSKRCRQQRRSAGRRRFSHCK